MTHDYGERMSLMLDGRLTAQERTELEAHLAVCVECHTRWVAFQQVDRVLSSAATLAPAPGFVNRFAERWAQHQALQTRRARRERAIAWVGVLVAGTAALALLTIPALIAAWLGLASLMESAPSLFVNIVTEIARWLVTLGALFEAGRSLLRSSGPLLAGYAVMLISVTAAWAFVMRNVTRRRSAEMLPMFIVIQ